MRVLRRIRSLVSTHAPQPTPADGSAVVARTDKKSIFTRALQGAVVLGAGLALTVGAAGLPQAVWATEDSAEAATEEAAAAQTYTAQATSSDKSAKSADELPVVTVDAPKGALPEGAELRAELVESEKDNQAVADELEKAEVSYDGFLALDVFFADADGNEVEPSEPVDVRFELPEGAVPEGAEDLAVHHLAEDGDGTVADVEAVADDADATEGTVAVQDDATVDAEFTVDSFSTFTITWNNNRWQSITIHCVDESGNEIGSNLDDVNRSSAIKMSDIAPDISGYTYDHAKVALRANADGAVFTQLRCEDWNWQYRTASGRNWQNVGGNSVYLVYSKNPVELTTVDTVDSTAEGVHMYMFDYDAPAFNDSVGGYGDGQTKEDLLQRTTDGNTGWPRFSSDSNVVTDDSLRNRSLSSYFGGTRSADNLSGSLNNSGREVNHLFRQDRFNENGTFYYSSFDTFATLQNDNDDNFTVYNQLGTPKNNDNQQQYFFQRGNFMPYNTLDTSNVLTHNLYDEYGQRLAEDAPRYDEDVYGFNEGNNFYFGMYLWADFYQPKDGMVEPNKGYEDSVGTVPMVFEFNGDDDMWVFIDGVLVLDLGGIHDAQSGSINFATGEVRYTDTVKGQPADWHETTLKAQYEAAKRDGSVDWDGNTFADGSSHRIQIFYMERGAGASNLKISFNLKTIPDGQLAVRKDVENYYAPQVDDIEYTMQVTVNGEPYADAEYTILGDEGTVRLTDSNGQFKLKHDQTAMFPDLQVGNEVTVEEVGSTDTGAGVDIDKNYDISYTVTDGAGNTTGDTGDDGTITAVMPGYGSIRVTVNNKATYTRPLKVVKNFDGTEGNRAPDGFEATYTLYEVDESGSKIEPAIGSVKYSDFENSKYTFWLDTNKDYTVVETFGEGDNKGDTGSSKWSSVTTTTNDPADGTEASDGIVHLEEHDATDGSDVDTITLTNHYGLTIKDVLKVTKTENGSRLLADMFEFTIEPQDSGEGETAVTAEDAAKKAGLNRTGDAYAYSNVGSADPGETGLARMGNEITFTTDDIGKTYVYEYAETGELTDDFKQMSKLSESDFIFDEARYRVELAVDQKDSKLQVTMTKSKWNADEEKWEQLGDSVTITSANCDCSEVEPLMTVDFENAYIQPAELNGSVGIEKTLEGDELKDSMFKFTITAQRTDKVSPEDAAIKAGSYDEDGIAITSWDVLNTFNEAGDSVFSIFGSMSFSGADVGKVYQYVVVEDADYIGEDYNKNDYLYDDTQYLIQFRPVIATSEGGDKSLEVELWVAERDGSEGDFSELAKVGVFSHGQFNHVDSQAQGRAVTFDPRYNLKFTNTVSKASLSISKVLEENDFNGFAPKDVKFTIRIVLKDKDDKPIVGPFSATGVEGQQSVTFNESGIATVTLKAGETITITGLPVGAKYTVNEPEESIPGGFKLVGVSGSGSDKPTTREALVDHIDGDIDPTNNNVTVTNMFVGYGLGIFKAELAYDENGDIALDDDGLPYADPEHPLSGAVFEISALNDEDEKQPFGRLETDEDGKAVFMSLPDNEGKTYQTFLRPGTYYINEVKVPSGYQLLGYEITLTINDGGKATISIPQDEGEDPIVKDLGYDTDGNLLIEVANKPNPDLPSSGSSGTVLMGGVGTAAIIVAGAWLLKQRGIDLRKFTSR